MQLPVISLTLDSGSFFDPDTGIYVPGRIYERLGYSSMYWGEPHGNYFQRGDEWERVAQLAYFVDGNQVLSQAVGIRIHGSGSRALPMKSLRIYARSRYGASKLNYPFFGEDYDHSFNRLILRNSGQDFYRRPTMIRDVVAAELFSSLNAPVHRYQQAIVFLNGEFWGIHNIRERFDRHYFERRFGIREGELDLLEDDAIASEGSNEHYRAFLSWIEQADLTGRGMLEAVAEYMDVDNYIDFLISHIFAQNTDWPGRNVQFWRNNGAPVPGVPETDGRWRWTIFDTDLAFHDARENTLLQALTEGRSTWPNPDWSTLLFRRLLTSPEFEDAFLNRLTTLLYTDLHAQRFQQVITERSEAIRYAIPHHAERWQHPEVAYRYPRGLYTWSHQIDRFQRFAQDREHHFRRHVQRTFDVDYIALETIVSNASAGRIHVNHSVLHEPDHTDDRPVGYVGRWISNQRLTIEARAQEGYAFAYWVLNNSEYVATESLTITPNSTTTIEAIFREVTQRNERYITTAWVFTNDIPNDVPIQRISPTLSRNEHTMLQYFPAIEGLNGFADSEGIMDRVNDPTSVNFPDNMIIPDTSSMRGIRVRNPAVVDENGSLRESMLVMRLPTTGMYNPVFSFAARRTVNGAQQLLIDVATSPNEEWIPLDNDWSLSETYSRYEVSLWGYPGANDNADVRIRIRFRGPSVFGTSGNVRFNNMLLEASLKPDHEFVSMEIDRPVVLNNLSNFPNPFNSSTTIRFELPVSSFIRADLYTIDGRFVMQLMERYAMAGEVRIPVNANSLATGMYIYRVRVREEILTGKMTLIR
jgi:hypothetical protein